MKTCCALLVASLTLANIAFAGWSSGGGGPPPAASEGVEENPLEVLNRPSIKIDLTDDEMAEKLAEALANPIKPKPISIDLDGKAVPFKLKNLDFKARTLILTSPKGEDILLKSISNESVTQD